ncbi:MAG: hypothetical protein AAGK02_07220 [Pseudomonadota bacterium]
MTYRPRKIPRTTIAAVLAAIPTACAVTGQPDALLFDGTIPEALRADSVEIVPHMVIVKDGERLTFPVEYTHTPALKCSEMSMKTGGFPAPANACTYWGEFTDGMIHIVLPHGASKAMMIHEGAHAIAAAKGWSKPTFASHYGSPPTAGAPNAQ